MSRAEVSSTLENPQTGRGRSHAISAIAAALRQAAQAAREAGAAGEPAGAGQGDLAVRAVPAVADGAGGADAGKGDAHRHAALALLAVVAHLTRQTLALLQRAGEEVALPGRAAHQRAEGLVLVIVQAQCIAVREQQALAEREQHGRIVELAHAAVTQQLGADQEVAVAAHEGERALRGSLGQHRGAAGLEAGMALEVHRPHQRPIDAREELPWVLWDCQGYGGIVEMPPGYIAGAFERVRAAGGNLKPGSDVRIDFNSAEVLVFAVPRA